MVQHQPDVVDEILCAGDPAGQAEPLVARIRGLIRDYPPGIGIVKEFLQNADDAGATWLKLVLDLRERPATRLPDSRMGPLLGPALLVISDQLFSDKDLVAIQDIGEGSKRQQGPKTGRFGLGFNTAYNLTDYPSFATRDRIVCFDPHRDAVARGDGRPGRRWSLGDLWQQAPDWPRAFDLPEGGTELSQTTFRLPLRRLDKTGPERIAQRPVSLPELVQTLDEVAVWGGALLLFTRSVMHLIVETVSAEGTRIERVRVRSSAPEAAWEHRVALRAACDDREEGLPALLTKWRQRPTELPADVYEHTFEVHARGEVRSERWLVSAGLFCDTNKKILDRAQEMLQIDEKALPLAGAAVRIENTADGSSRCAPVVGALYCTLPLPGASSLPVHVNGYFDLDRSRTGLPPKQSLIGNAAVRAAWNEALIEHAVAPAVSALIAELKNRCGEADPVAFYGAWPDPGVTATTPLAELTRHVYARLATLSLLRTRQGSSVSWRTAATTRVPGTGWSTALASALCADGFSLPEPALPLNVAAGLALLDQTPKAWTTQDLRARLQQAPGLPIAIEQAPMVSLRGKPLVLELLRLFLTTPSQALTGLPLALTSDGMLRVFGSRYVFRGSAEVRSLLDHDRELFLDRDVQEGTTIKAGTDKVHEMVADNVLWAIEQKKMLSPKAGATSLAWNPDDPDLPNEAWLTRLLRYLSNHDLDKNGIVLRTLALLPGQDSRLHRPGELTSPAFGGTSISADLQRALSAHAIPMLGGSEDLKLAVQVAARKHPLLARLISASNLVSTLVALASGNGQLPGTPEDRALLVDFLATQDNQTPMDSGRIQALRGLALWPTTTGGYAQPTGERTYVPGSYTPPAFTGALTLLSPGPGRRWRALLTRLEVPDLDLAAYLERVFIPDYARLDEEQQRIALAWLRDLGSLATLIAEVGETRARRVRERLRSASLIRSVGGELRPATQLYHPEAEADWTVLGPVAQLPDMRFYGEPAHSWIHLFSSLGMHRQPQADDLLQRVDQLVASVALEGLDVVEPLVGDLLAYLDTHWERLKGEQVEDGRTGLGQALGRRAWLPAVRDPAHSQKVAGFQPAAERLYFPHQLFPARLQHLVASQAPILHASRELHAQLRKSLSMPGKVSADLMARHFCAVRELWESPGHGGLSSSAVGDMASEIFRSLGRQLRPPSQTTDDDDPPEPPQHVTSALNRIRAAPCIWHTETGRFWPPEHVFASKVPFFGDLRVQIATQGAEGDTLSRLGRRTDPGAKDFIAFLRDLSVERGGRPLDDEGLKRALYACQWLDRDEAREELTPDLPLPCKDGVLRPARVTLIDDAPWLRPRLNQVPIPWVHPATTTRLAEDAGSGRASELLHETLLAQEPTEDADLRQMCGALQKHLERRELHVGLLRLVQAEHGPAALNVEEVTSLRVTASARLRSTLTCPDLFGDRAFGEADVEVFVEGRHVYLAADNRDDAIPALSQAINRQLGVLQLSDLAPLEDILRRRPELIEGALDRRHIPRLNDQDLEVTFNWEMDDDAPDEAVDPEGESAEPAQGPGPWNPSRSQPGEPTGDIGDADVVRPQTRAADPNWRPTGDANAPPVAPGPGHSRLKIRRRGHLRSYVFSAGHAVSTGVLAGRPDTTSPEIASAALAFVADQEARQGRAVQAMEPGHEGYDVHVSVPGEAEPRCVEVKGLRGAWDRSGVSLRPAQISAAFALRDRYWLYVVEHALDPAEARLSRIQDPAGHITEFRLDEGWRALAEVEAKLEPEPDLLIAERDTPLGKIIEVKTFGETRRLTIEKPDGQTMKCPYNPAVHRLSRSL